jgi:hypothetical protein
MNKHDCDIISINFLWKIAECSNKYKKNIRESNKCKKLVLNYYKDFKKNCINKKLYK